MSDLNKKFTTDIPEGLAKNKEELIEKLQAPSLTFSDGKKQIEVLHEDGSRVPVGQIFFREGDNMLVGEIIYCHAREQDLERGEQRETIIPLLVLGFYRNGVLCERVWNPYQMSRKVEFNDKPVLIEMRTRYMGTLETLMSLEAAKRFIAGCELPEWNDVYSEVKGVIEVFVNLEWDQRLKDVVACWVFATYFQEIFNVLPFLYPYGSTGTGKTRLLKTAVYLSRHGFLVTDPTEAVLFRMAEALKPTLGIDESLLGSTAWKLIRTAFKRGLYVPRMEKTHRDEFILGLFETFMPVAFGSTQMPKELGGLDADEARAIFIFMQKMPDPVGRDPEPWEFKSLRDKLYLLRLGRANEVLKAIQQVEGLALPFSGHEREIWLPLLAIAKILGETVFNNILSYASEFYSVKLSRQNMDEKIVVRAVLLMYRNLYVESVKTEPKIHIPNIEFSSSNLQTYIKNVLQDWGEYEEFLFNKQWDSRRIGRILTRLGIFKKLKHGRSYYIVTAESLQLLYKQFFQGGCGGFGGLKKESILPGNNPPGGGGGLKIDSIDLVFNPPNPPNPPTSKSVVRLERISGSLFPTEKCAACGSSGVDFQATYTDGSWSLLCFECAEKIQEGAENE